MDTNNNIQEVIFDLIEAGKRFKDLTWDEKKTVLTEFDSAESYDIAVHFQRTSRIAIEESETPPISSGVKEELMNKFREKHDDHNVKQGSILGFVPTAAGVLKLGMAASLLLGSMLFTNNGGGGSDAFAADTATVHIDTSTFSLRDTSNLIKDTITVR